MTCICRCLDLMSAFHLDELARISNKWETFGRMMAPWPFDKKILTINTRQGDYPLHYSLEIQILQCGSARHGAVCLNCFFLLGTFASQIATSSYFWDPHGFHLQPITSEVSVIVCNLFVLNYLLAPVVVSSVCLFIFFIFLLLLMIIEWWSTVPDILGISLLLTEL